MSYAGSRRIIDVDSHLFELDDFLYEAALPEERELIRDMAAQRDLPVSAEAIARGRELFAKRQRDPHTLAKFEEDVLAIRPNPWSRLGAFDPAERSHTEGSDDPIRRFEAALGDRGPGVLDAFYSGNMMRLMEPAT